MNTDALHTTQDPDKLREIALFLQETNRALTQRLHELEEALKLATQARFGRKSEAFTGEQRQLAEEDVTADRADIRRQLRALLPERNTPKQKPVRGEMPGHLPREETVLNPESTTACPDCGVPLRHIRDEVSEKLEYVPAHFVVHKTVRPQYGCPSCDTVHSASLPPSLIEKGQPGPGLLAQVVISKTCDHLPLHRQQKIYARAGVSLPASTLSDWFGEVGAALSPLAAALRRDLLAQPVLQADETPLMVLDTQKGKAKKGYLWAYVSAAGSAREVVIYDCCLGRSGQHARDMLSGWSGTLVVDDYGGYKALFRDEDENGDKRVPAVEAGCWAHARRKFADLFKMNCAPEAAEALVYMGYLYDLEHAIRARSAEQKRRWRQRYAKPHVEVFHGWLTEKKATSAPGGVLHKAIGYVLKRWTALLAYLDDGRVPVDNNRCERAMRPVAMGRKAWLFAGSQRAGERMADLMSLVETARLNGLEPWGWLREVLEKLPSWPASHLDELLPYARKPQQ